MAVLLLQAAGAYLGGLFGPIGGAIGTAAGALAGYALDRALIDGTRRRPGPRLAGARPFSAEEGVAIPRLYGTARLGGAMIWAIGVSRTESSEHAGRAARAARRSPSTAISPTSPSRCARARSPAVRRVWADGRELDLNGIEMRVHVGQCRPSARPAISARQGAGNTPAYRGLAYVVFERLPLGDYGNRIPQIQFEVLRPVGRLRQDIRGVALIPGTTEYGLDPERVTKGTKPGDCAGKPACAVCVERSCRFARRIAGAVPSPPMLRWSSHGSATI